MPDPTPMDHHAALGPIAWTEGGMRDFGDALRGMLAGEEWRRVAHKPDKTFGLHPAKGYQLSYLEIRYHDGRLAPWTPTRCDLLTADWMRVAPARAARPGHEGRTEDV